MDTTLDVHKELVLKECFKTVEKLRQTFMFDVSHYSFIFRIPK